MAVGAARRHRRWARSQLRRHRRGQVVKMTDRTRPHLAPALALLLAAAVLAVGVAAAVIWVVAG